VCVCARARVFVCVAFVHECEKECACMRGCVRVCERDFCACVRERGNVPERVCERV